MPGLEVGNELCELRRGVSMNLGTTLRIDPISGAPYLHDFEESTSCVDSAAPPKSKRSPMSKHDAALEDDVALKVDPSSKKDPSLCTESPTPTKSDPSLQADSSLPTTDAPVSSALVRTPSTHNHFATPISTSSTGQHNLSNSIHAKPSPGLSHGATAEQTLPHTRVPVYDPLLLDPSQTASDVRAKASSHLQTCNHKCCCARHVASVLKVNRDADLAAHQRLHARLQKAEAQVRHVLHVQRQGVPFARRGARGAGYGPQRGKSIARGHRFHF